MENKIHSISKIEGIGSKFEKIFINKSITYSEDLILQPLAVLRKKFSNDKKILRKIKDFKTQALFLNITKNVQLAEAFQKAGLQGLSELSARDPQKLVDIVEDAKKKGLLKESITLHDAFNIQKKAIETKHTSIFFGTLKNKNSEPLVGADIYINHRHTTTDKNGKFFITGVNYGKRSVVIKAEGYNEMLTTKEFKLNKNVRHTFILNKGNKKINRTKVKVIYPDHKFKTKTINIEDVNKGDQFYLNKFYKNGYIKLRSIKQIHKDNITITNILKVKQELLDYVNLKNKQTFQWNGNSFKKLSESILKLRVLTNKTIK